MVERELNSTNMSLLRTALSNQRTHLSYIRTGFAITAVAVKLKSHIIIGSGILVIAIGVFQYYTIATNLEKDTIVLPNKEIPLIFTVAGIMAVYYYWTIST